uniref:Secreted protein n=2 Tax=Arundo donax TaxID=35708 RepID=A0A0A9EQQ8_ARUDO
MWLSSELSTFMATVVWWILPLYTVPLDPDPILSASENDDVEDSISSHVNIEYDLPPNSRSFSSFCILSASLEALRYKFCFFTASSLARSLTCLACASTVYRCSLSCRAASMALLILEWTSISRASSSVRLSAKSIICSEALVDSS